LTQTKHCVRGQQRRFAEQARAQELHDILRNLEGLYAAVVADVLDKLGYPDQVVHPCIRPIYPEARLVGRAFTVAATPSTERRIPPYEIEFAALDSLGPHDIFVYASKGGVGATWGELFSARARLRGCLGCLTDGMVRDTARMIRMRFPVFCAGFCPADTYGRVQAIAYGVPVICGGVTVRPGDIVLGDYDGVVIVPSDVVSEVIRLAHDKASTESKVRAALMRGESVKSVYAKYGVM